MIIKPLTTAAYRSAFDASGAPRANGPRCATCGDLAVWGTHPRCRKQREKLVVLVAEDDQVDRMHA